MASRQRRTELDDQIRHRRPVQGCHGEVRDSPTGHSTSAPVTAHKNSANTGSGTDAAWRLPGARHRRLDHGEAALSEQPPSKQPETGIVIRHHGCHNNESRTIRSGDIGDEPLPHVEGLH